ncbi:PP2C family protein-serine/threonine phosphatase [Salirhabdus salicampi]|uniref:PP2C family protein-serine/threonine phosphatase n=1 Tax=Salirhabdus salicampi TaxID=476102 RepID=UPI0020C4CC2F|nr:PP2C family protein-serine/threonine phosphatase [Salirhabdus salicampi]MCP8618086.1 PP2C family protein-serine/threonine phosphatase [Salirhabdus salicampi]
MEKYKRLLKQYITTKDESALYKADRFSKDSLQNNISPDEIVQIHIESLTSLYPNLPEHVMLSFNFLLETMIAYGVAHKEFQALREKQMELKSEIEVAANLQKSLMDTKVPEVEGIEVGAISVPSRQMNGDYYQFLKDRNGNLSVTIADIIGKGMPAALSMSMIKYALNSLHDQRSQPSEILDVLNRIVEQNVSSEMFITMFYGFYDTNHNKFHYSSAGHEPGFLYSQETNQFTEINAKGIALGIKSPAKYESNSVKLEKGDMAILLTDGVTECRCGDQFIDRKEVLNKIQEFKHLPAQEIVQKVYKHFEQIQDFDLKDDFTLILVRRKH